MKPAAFLEHDVAEDHTGCTVQTHWSDTAIHSRQRVHGYHKPGGIMRSWVLQLELSKIALLNTGERNYATRGPRIFLCMRHRPDHRHLNNERRTRCGMQARENGYILNVFRCHTTCAAAACGYLAHYDVAKERKLKRG